MTHRIEGDIRCKCSSLADLHKNKKGKLVLSGRYMYPILRILQKECMQCNQDWFYRNNICADSFAQQGNYKKYREWRLQKQSEVEIPKQQTKAIKYTVLIYFDSLDY